MNILSDTLDLASAFVQIPGIGYVAVDILKCEARVKEAVQEAGVTELVSGLDGEGETLAFYAPRAACLVLEQLGSRALTKDELPNVLEYAGSQRGRNCRRLHQHLTSGSTFEYVDLRKGGSITALVAIGGKCGGERVDDNHQYDHVFADTVGIREVRQG